MQDSTCELCSGSGHIQDVEGKWSRCVCLEKADWRKYLGFLSKFKGINDKSAKWMKKAYEAADLPDKSIRVALINFKAIEEFYPAFKAFLLSFPDQISYSCIDGWNLVSIYLKDESSDFLGIDSLNELGLLVLILDDRILPNRMLRHLLRRVLESRKQGHKPTWIVSPYSTRILAKIVAPEDSDFVSFLDNTIDTTFRKD